MPMRAQIAVNARRRDFLASGDTERLADVSRRKFDPLFLFACAVEWKRNAGQETGCALFRALNSTDDCARRVASAFLEKAL